MYILRIRLAAALLITLSLLAGCDSKSPSQTSNSKAEAVKPNQSAQFNDEQILSRIKSIVAKQLSLDTNVIDVDAPLSKQKVAADELDVIEIIMNVEETFGVEIRDEEVSHPEGHLKDDLSVRKLAQIVAMKKRGGK
jgi:acyl carrier protein